MRDSPADFLAQEILKGIAELHQGELAPCDGNHSTHVVGYLEWLESVKPGKPLTRPQRRAIRERVAQVCWSSECPAYKVPAQVLWSMAVELSQRSPRRRRPRPDSGA